MQGVTYRRVLQAARTNFDVCGLAELNALLRDEETVAVLCVSNPERSATAATPRLANLWGLRLSN